MKVLIQWAKSQPEDWEELELARVQDWRQLPRKDRPISPNQPVDTQPGWINAINIQGVIFSGFDRFSIDQSGGGGIDVFAWQDSEDFPPGTRWASRWTFLNPAPDPNIGNRINTRQTRQVYAEPDAGIPPEMNPLPWDQFPVPNQNNQRFGKWLPDELFLDHMRTLSRRGWEEWT